jgi:hypothetical protein
VRRSSARVAALATALVAVALPLSASADHNSVEQLSIGPAGGNGALAAAWAGASEDGSRAFFETSEQLVSADTDARTDVYQSAGGTTTLVSAGAIGGNGSFNAFFAGASSDGTRVFFGSAEKLVSGDTDTQTDIYERSGGTTTQVSTGPNGGNGAYPAFFDGASADGSRVFLHTAEKLTLDDVDSQSDIYERAAGTTTRVSAGAVGGNGDFPAFFGGSSEDGLHVFFETQESLSVGDADAFIDVYDGSGGSSALVSTGSTGGNGASDAFFDGNSTDGSRAFFTTDESLEPSDLDAQYDVYQRLGASTTRLSTGPGGGNGATDALYRGASEDGTSVFFETAEPLTAPGDADTNVDVYERSPSGTANLSTGPAGGNGSFDATYGGSTPDGSQVFIETEEILTVEDVDAQLDVYDTSVGSTALVSIGPAGGNGAFDASFRATSQSGARVFFQTAESLATPDSDASNDVYERSSSGTSRVSGGISGGNGAFDASFAAASRDGSKLFFATIERLVTGDTDSSQDLYVATAAPNYPRPGGATPLRVPMVPAFAACTSPNSNHVPPLDSPSCTPAPLESALLTTSTLGKGAGVARLDTVLGNPATPEDEADIRIILSTTDIRRAGDGSDYPGQLIFSVGMRITDRANSSFETTPGTVRDSRFDVPISCGTTADDTIGSTCNLNLSTDVIVPDFIKEGRRTVVSAFSLHVLDAGADSSITPPSGACPPTCGSGDEKTFLTQGIFTP